MKLDQTGLKKAICGLKVPFFQSLPGVNGLRAESLKVFLLVWEHKFFNNCTLRLQGTASFWWKPGVSS